MRIANPMAVRPFFYDRNPVNRQQQYVAYGVAPHTWTVRFSYTVPTYKKAWLEYAEIDFIRRTAATTAGEVTVAVYTTPSGGNAANFVVFRITSNTTNSQAYRNATTQSLLVSGDNVAAGTADASTDGTYDYTITVHMTEFDA